MSRVKRLRRKLITRTKGHEEAARALGVSIGTGCRILSPVATTEPWLVRIGDRVTVSSGVRLVTHDGSGWLVRDHRGRRYRYAPISIGDDVFIGAGATILPGVKIGDRVVVGAGSVVSRSVPSGTVVAGVPARRLGTWDDFVARVASWPADEDRRGSSYREKVDSIAEKEFAPEL
ncbi:acyltransferase [Nocardioides zeae]|uniref:Acyltransferase n=1 Tax=Nocardioides imazamoxiresistens TaxID=3231893 RepID=A0ABU3PWG6_9ACTN|nr:acyltransferase [Nocardioides zeae]MDT9593573.1 acyltransferase [Nocardioides zeae]